MEVPKRRRIWEVVRAIWITAGLTFLVVFTTWSLLAYRASSEAEAALASTNEVLVSHDSGVWRFESTAMGPSSAALIFFPGALYFLSTFYNRKQMALRSAILYSGSQAGNAFGGLFAIAILNLDGVHGLEGWRWVCYPKYLLIKVYSTTS